jgi:hypothetical protein
MEIIYQGQVTKKEYNRVIEIHYSKMKWIRWLVGAFIVILLISLVITIIQQPTIMRSLFPGFLFPIIILSSPWWVLVIQKNSYNQSNNIYRTPIHGVIDDAGISVSNENTSVKSVWNGYTHFIKKDDILVLYQGKNCFNIFTKNMFSNEQDWNKFLKIIGEKVSQR